MSETNEKHSQVIVVTSANRDQALAGLPLFFKIACNIAEKIQIGSLRFNLPDGRALLFCGKQSPQGLGVIDVRDFAFARRAVLGGDIGFFESYADGQWDSPDITGVLFVFATNADHVSEAFTGSPLFGWLDRVRHLLNKNTRSGSRRNIIAHYDLGNSFYQRWLDPTMTYSSARFGDSISDLSEAQTNKYKTLAKSIALQPGETVLEIGSGWGGFAEFAAREVGAKVTGLTISPAQLEFAQRRIFEAGLAEKVDFRLLDYRDASGAYDKIASIEMFEAVGQEYWPVYFDKVRNLLKPGGVAGLQIITIADRFFEGYSRSTDFIQRYVFPGGMLPSPKILQKHFDDAGLTLRQNSAFGQDYARTLGEWHNRFLSAWDDIAQMGFDERFKRLWRFYLSYCEAGFRAATTDVVQASVTRA
jgi:cyclopropane-fatty-acyl-phospholipid synthase